MKSASTPATSARIMVVDDDASVRDGLVNLLVSVGYDVKAYATPGAFLETADPVSANCLILDVRLPLASGFDLHAALAEERILAPVIFITGFGDIPMSVRAMKAGAVDFLVKPFRDQDLLDAVATAVAGDRRRRADEEARSYLANRFASLSTREQQVLRLVTSGLMNKEVAFALGLSEITVKIHRGKVMRKMEVATFAELVRLAEQLDLSKGTPQTEV